MSGPHYNTINQNASNSPYQNSSHNESTGFITPEGAQRKRTSPWLKFGLPAIILVLVIIGAVLGGVLGSRASRDNKAASASQSADAAASSAASAKADIGRFAQATNSQFMVPIYPSTTNAAFSAPTFAPSSNVNGGNGNTWPKDSFAPSNPSPLNLRPDRPRLIAPQYKWDALPGLIASDPYLQSWNDTIFGNASDYASRPPVVYFMDGDSGILDVAREVKERIKAFSYVYRLTKDRSWVDLAWRELQNAVSDTWRPENSNDKWNTAHFLDTAELSAAYGIAYDWLNDAWSDDQKGQIRDWMNRYGLGPGAAAYTDPSATYAWWKNDIRGNWNCVCNGGLTVAALAILDDDTTGNARTILSNAIDNAKANCILATSSDGTWAETANYWYFGTTGHAEMASALITATGSDYGLLNDNDNFKKTGDFHMYVYGATSLFNYGDHGPNKFSTTANSIIFYASAYNLPKYALFQRDRPDAAEPWSMFWYDPSVAGAFWADAPLDMFFDDDLDQWVSMRSSFTDINALYVAMKAGANHGHQNHNDLDAGDFVIDAMGTRWAGELGSGDYLAPGYFVGDNQDSQRWMYYRTMTEGQNTLLINKKNQLVAGQPKIIKHESGGAKQSSGTTVYTPPSGADGAAYWIADLTNAYDNADASSVHRGVRVFNARRQVLIRDEVTTNTGFQWRMHTNATVSIDGSTATLSLDGKETKVVLTSPSGVSWTQSEAKRMAGTPPAPDQENTGVTVLIAEIPQGSQTVEVVFNPSWGEGVELKTPPSVELSAWGLGTHD
ncbi:heparinase ii iii family protein [Moniliophthora roreri MCA 2997]|uniref:Heparinase ii iii family protein n=2 Tax=Moniliophthora roreri TaxID=221103 RepID=V2WPF3_MONRO|nr:heparinase ii iii family protein [Moniliophthora roreri MCA 2997]